MSSTASPSESQIDETGLHNDALNAALIELMPKPFEPDPFATLDENEFAEVAYHDEPVNGWDHPGDLSAFRKWYARRVELGTAETVPELFAYHARRFGISPAIAYELFIELVGPASPAEIVHGYRTACFEAGSKSITIPNPDPMPEPEFDDPVAVAAWKVRLRAAEQAAWDKEQGQESDNEALVRINSKYVGVLDPEFRFVYLAANPDMKGRSAWKSMSDRSFRLLLGNQSIEKEGGKTGERVPLADAWIKWPRRLFAQGMRFDSSLTPGDTMASRMTRDGYLNLWMGYGVTPKFKRNGWMLLMQMIRDDLCAGDEEVFAYVIKWIAWKIQNPGDPCGTALVFKGLKGVGKTTLGELLIDIFGSHGLAVSSHKQFAGEFNGHLANACFVLADEAVWGGDVQNEGMLKKLITDTHALHHAKFKDAVYAVNRVGLMMLTNAEWAAPASFDERRFMVSQVSDRHRVKGKDDHTNVAYWKALRAEIRNGGRESFMFDMQHMELEDWSPIIGAPKTAALGAQIEEGLKGVQRWYYDLLSLGELPSPTDEDADWPEHAKDVESTVILKACMDWMRSNGQQAHVTHRGLFKQLKQFGWAEGQRTNARKKWRAPSHADAVKRMESLLGRKMFEAD